MNIDDTLSGRARSQGIRWLLLSTTAKKALADQLRGLLPVGEGVGECRDTSHLAAPGLDLGCLLADGRFWQARPPEAGFQEIQESFLARHAPGVPKERLMRARLYEAIRIVKRAVRRVQLFENDWASRTKESVGPARGVLNGFRSMFGQPLRSISLKEKHHETKIPLSTHPPFPGPVDCECG